MINGKDAITSVLAGVGSPIKESVCRSSKLNLANRIAEKMVTKKLIEAIGFWNSEMVLYTSISEPGVPAKAEKTIALLIH